MAKPKPAPLRERDITRQIAREYYKEFDQLIESDVIIVGAGPSGLICAHDLAAMGFRTVIVEQSLALGGGFWSGGYLMNKATICEPANEILEEIGVPCKKITECEGMYMVDPPHATGALIAAAYRGGARIMNLTRVVDLILRRDGILEGVVVNNTTAEMAGHDILHVDPIALERDRKSTRLNSSHSSISYAVFCLKKKINFTLSRLLSEKKLNNRRSQ